MQPNRVLIVDDNPSVRAALRTWLSIQSEVVLVGEAANGREAICLVEECQPDVVLMDVHMPVLDGIQATKLIKQRWPAVTVIMHTLNAMDQSIALAVGADGFVIKGDVPQHLLYALSEQAVGRTW